MNYALDTNAASDALSDRGRVRARLQAIGRDEVGLPAPAAYELERGALYRGFSRKRLQDLQEFIAILTVIPFDLAAARHAADIEVQLRAKGQPIGLLDVWVAGVARAHGLILVTHNTREFARVPSLQVEDWYGLSA